MSLTHWVACGVGGAGGRGGGSLPSPGPQFPHLHGEWAGEGTGSLGGSTQPVAQCGEARPARAPRGVWRAARFAADAALPLQTALLPAQCLSLGLWPVRCRAREV